MPACIMYFGGNPPVELVPYCFSPLPYDLWECVLYLLLQTLNLCIVLVPCTCHYTCSCLRDNMVRTPYTCLAFSKIYNAVLKVNHYIALATIILIILAFFMVMVGSMFIELDICLRFSKIVIRNTNVRILPILGSMSIILMLTMTIGF